MHRIRLTLLSTLLLLSACGTSAPSSDVTAKERRVAAMSTYGALLQIPLSGWTAADRHEEGAVVFTASGATKGSGIFVVRPALKDRCATLFIVGKARSTMRGPAPVAHAPHELSQHGATYAYVWQESRSDTGSALLMDTHWCIDGQAPGADIEVIAPTDDEATQTVIESAFIPLWRRGNK